VIDDRGQIRQRQRTEANISRSRIPRHTRANDLDNLTKTAGNERAFALVESFLNNEIGTPILLLIGVPGVGKTTLAWRIGWVFLQSGERVLYYQAEELLNELQADLENGKEFGRLWARLKEADLVILDDIGAHNRTPWREAQLDALVDYRYRERIPLVMTTNKLDLSERILDRVKEGVSCVITGESWRGKDNNV